jgi:hypothetical protein
MAVQKYQYTRENFKLDQGTPVGRDHNSHIHNIVHVGHITDK